MRLPRIYLLDGKEINSSEVSGFVHVARDDKWGNCIACGEQLKKGQKRVRMNIFGSDEPIHFNCYVSGHSEPCILGVKTRKGYCYGVERNFVICKIVSLENGEK